MAEITAQGFRLKTVNEWFESERQLYLNIDSDWNLDPSTPDGLKLASDSEVFGALDETLQQAYNSKDPNKAVGIDLDVIGSLTGAKRSQGTPSVASITMTGVPGTFVPAGTRVESTANGSRWALDQSYTLDGTGMAVANFTCIAVGPTEAPTGTITRIVDTVGGLTSVNNPTPATPGTDVENDSAFRVKRATAVGRPGNNQVDSMYGELYAVEGVRRVKVYENDTNATDTNGLPPHSLAILADGGSDTDIALAIYTKKNPGVALYQTGTPVTVTVVSPIYPSNTKEIKFGRPLYVDMVIDVVLKDDGNLPSIEVLEPMIQDAFVEFAGGDLIPADVGFKIDGFDIGESVPYSTMFTPVNQVIGPLGNAYVQSMTLNGSSANVNIAFNELARWTTSNISVSIV